jgi:hypothetical protein
LPSYATFQVDQSSQSHWTLPTRAELLERSEFL